MIVVIADDFTGAAEIGGIGLRHGLKTMIDIDEVQTSNHVDLLIVATDTRSLKPTEASEVISRITKQLLQFKPKLIYKKLDSVLRGNIKEELIAQMKITDKSRAVIIAANPVFNRAIKDGIYYIDDIPLVNTCFATDPQYPIKSSAVLDILDGKNGDYPMVNLKSDAKLPDDGLIIGDVTNFDDLEKWAIHLDDRTLLAGASGFFDAILGGRKFGPSKGNVMPTPFGEKALYLMGSTYPKERDFLKQLEANGHYLSNMPEEIYYNKDFDPVYIDYWVKDIEKGIRENGKVIASIDHSPGHEPGLALRLRENIGKTIRKVVELVELDELLIEGGSTTFVVLKHLKIKKITPVQELDTGVIRMKMDEFPGLCLTTKPGSYYWPENVWVPNDIQRFNHIAYD